VCSRLVFCSLFTVMTVNKELSVVADSTHSPSSPFPNVKTRTVKRTYGRPKMSDDPDTSLSFPPSSSASRNSTYRTGPPDLDEQVPPSSDFSHSFSDNELADDENEGSPQDAPADDFFGVKRMMRDYDATHGFDVDMSDIPHASHSEQPPVTETLSFQRVQSPHVPTSPAVAPSNALTHDLLEESPSTLTTSPLSQSAIPQSPSSHVGHARRRLKRRVMDGSDSESEPAGNKCTSATRSPAFPHAISTPKSRSSPTPPTSDDEMPAYPMQRHNSKGKGKANPPASRPTVAPLQFSEGPNGSSVGSKKSMRKDKRSMKTKIKVSYPKQHR
jgi:mediator of replication checkpoint protein 1